MHKRKKKKFSTKEVEPESQVANHPKTKTFRQHVLVSPAEAGIINLNISEFLADADAYYDFRYFLVAEIYMILPLDLIE